MNEPQIFKQYQISNEITNEHQISKETRTTDKLQILIYQKISKEMQITSEPQISKQSKISKESRVSKEPQISQET